MIYKRLSREVTQEEILELERILDDPTIIDKLNLKTVLNTWNKIKGTNIRNCLCTATSRLEFKKEMQQEYAQYKNTQSNEPNSTSI